MGIIFSMILHKYSRKRPYRALVLPTDNLTRKIFFSDLPLPNKVTDTTTEIRYNSMMEIVSFNCRYDMLRNLFMAETAKGIDWVVIVVNASNHKTATVSSDIIMKNFQGFINRNNFVIILVYNPKLKNSLNKIQFLIRNIIPKYWRYVMDEVKDAYEAKEFVGKLFGDKILQFRLGF
ncbi:hypothetical protein SteCoe_358 [Stentor coeruleus]|uniref:Uncharacterized protein n=1 Tax=Stentor coeruleus TaxID=5963 RepID=A0A1R2D4I8_9CILI|nr:hypothetical protein SteCoe_358 [Stentor coeruleus]